MCFFAPSFPFRNTIVVDSETAKDYPAGIFPQPVNPETRRPIVWIPYFPHQNFIHVRAAKDNVDEELPAPQNSNGLTIGKWFKMGGSTGSVLRNRFAVKKGSAEKKNEMAGMEGSQNLENRKRSDTKEGEMKKPEEINDMGKTDSKKVEMGKME